MRALSTREYELIAAIHQANESPVEVCETQAAEFAAGDPEFQASEFLRKCGHPLDVDVYSALKLVAREPATEPRSRIGAFVGRKAA
jgi:hypothetical protein